jgi:hypothetical protein
VAVREAGFALLFLTSCATVKSRACQGAYTGGGTLAHSGRGRPPRHRISLSAGLVRWDLALSSVLITVDGPRVIDFGIARALTGGPWWSREPGHSRHASRLGALPAGRRRACSPSASSWRSPRPRSPLFGGGVGSGAEDRSRGQEWATARPRVAHP